MSEATKPRVLIFVLTYNAQKHIESVLDRIPESLFTGESYSTDVIIIDDMSKDDTISVSNNYPKKAFKNVTVMRNPVNQRYGGNQKIGYTYAIEHGYDAVVMLHGDGQYAPEYLEEMLKPLLSGQADAVFGSRMLSKDSALKGGMPLYKFAANIFLTKTQNFILGANLSEFHSGYRAYSIETLKSIPFQYNSNDFDFDTDIIIQLIDTKKRIHEVPIPTHYGDEVCHVNGTKYALQIMLSTFISRVQRLGLLYAPKFDYKFGKQEYADKTSFDSSHSFALDQIKPDSTVLDFSSDNRFVVKKLKEKNCKIYGYNSNPVRKDQENYASLKQADIENFDFSMLSAEEKTADYILLLDMLEQRENPEQFLYNLRQAFSGEKPEIIITAANVGFIIVRLMLLIGQFNYGKHGILDMTHKRLFTFKSLRKLLESHGYAIKTVKAIAVPVNLITGTGIISKLLLSINQLLMKISKGLFAFQAGVIASPLPTLDTLLENAKQEGKRLEKDN